MGLGLHTREMDFFSGSPTDAFPGACQQWLIGILTGTEL